MPSTCPAGQAMVHLEPWSGGLSSAPAERVSWSFSPAKLGGGRCCPGTAFPDWESRRGNRGIAGLIGEFRASLGACHHETREEIATT